MDGWISAHHRESGLSESQSVIARKIDPVAFGQTDESQCETDSRLRNDDSTADDPENDAEFLAFRDRTALMNLLGCIFEMYADKDTRAEMNQAMAFRRKRLEENNGRGGTA